MKITFCTFILLLISFTSSAQDTIVRQSGDTITARIIEITESQIKYKRFDHQEGPIRNVSLNDVKLIIYNDGSRERFVQIHTRKKETSHKESNNEETQSDEPKDLIFDNGMFVDGLLSIDVRQNNYYYGNSSQIELGVGARFGHKWYFGKSPVARIGVQATWLRASFFFYDEPEFLNIAPAHVGLTSIWRTGENSGIEANVGIGPSLFIDFGFGNNDLTLSVNPEVKFRLKNFSLGIDYIFARNLFNTYSAFSNQIMSLSIGAKF